MKRVKPRNRIVQRSFCIKRRQDDFINWAEENVENFNWNKLLRDKLDEQITQLNPEYLDNEA
jgi:hypothetical protein